MAPHEMLERVALVHLETVAFSKLQFWHAIHSYMARFQICRSGAMPLTFYGSPLACPVCAFLHHVDESHANCRSS